MSPYADPYRKTREAALRPSPSRAERAILAALVQFPDLRPGILRGLRDQDVTSLHLRAILSTLRAMDLAGEAVDQLSLVETLEERHPDPSAYGGMDSVLDLWEDLVLPGAVPSRLQELKNATTRRGIVETCRDLEALAADSHDPDEILAVGQVALENLAASTGRAAPPVASLDTLGEILAHADRGGGLTGVPSGFTDLDAMTNGWGPGTLSILAARPSMGKSALALNFALNAARGGTPVAFFALESSAKALHRRLLSHLARVDSHQLMTGMLTEQDRADLYAAQEELASLAPIWIVDDVGRKPSEILSAARALKAKGAGLVIVDHLNLVSGEEEGGSEYETITAASGRFKFGAKALELPFLVLCQLSRTLEARTNKRPTLADLRGSGAIEQDADMVLFLYREDYYLKAETPEDLQGVAELDLAKSRDGLTGTVELLYSRRIHKFQPPGFLPKVIGGER